MKIFFKELNYFEFNFIQLNENFGIVVEGQGNMIQFKEVDLSTYYEQKRDIDLNKTDIYTKKVLIDLCFVIGQIKNKVVCDNLYSCMEWRK